MKLYTPIRNAIFFQEYVQASKCGFILPCSMFLATKNKQCFCSSMKCIFHFVGFRAKPRNTGLWNRLVCYSGFKLWCFKSDCEFFSSLYNGDSALNRNGTLSYRFRFQLPLSHLWLKYRSLSFATYYGC